MMKSFEDKCGQKLNLSELLMSPARLKEAAAQKLVSRVCSKKILVKRHDGSLTNIVFFYCDRRCS